MQRAPASADDSTEAKRDALLRTVAIDLGCQTMDIVLVLERRYANTAAPRYVIEACGTRALYAETCESWPSCRYVLVSALKLPQAVVVPTVAAAAAAPSPADARGQRRARSVPGCRPEVPVSTPERSAAMRSEPGSKNVSPYCAT